MQKIYILSTQQLQQCIINKPTFLQSQYYGYHMLKKFLTPIFRLTQYYEVSMS